MSERIFVSYSHQDAPLVTPVVSLLRATRDLVFLDSDSITPGKRWRKELSAGLLDANLVVVFWCLHSSQSSEVAKEYKEAVQAAKDVLPVLLDSTPVPTDLSEFQWIDFRELAREQHEGTESSGIRSPGKAPRVPFPTGPTPAPSRHAELPQKAPGCGFRGFRIAAFAGGAAALCLFLMVSLFTFILAPKTAEHTMPPPPPDTQPLPVPEYSFNGMLPLVIVVGFLLALTPVVVHVIRRKRTKALDEVAVEAATGREKQMADTLQEEILKRLKSRATR